MLSNGWLFQLHSSSLLLRPPIFFKAFLFLASASPGKYLACTWHVFISTWPKIPGTAWHVIYGISWGRLADFKLDIVGSHDHEGCQGVLT
mmetsp:Transcript_2580/g.5967  ORF Transcript_2580/g.5967 Transcript_2580/m.5967 type:complete len:90 (-) Transcript_2580:24-293(-)